jgi:uncharacterized membrane protein YfcA
MSANPNAFSTPVVERRRRLDVASLALMLTGVIAGGYSGWLIATQGHHPILLIPSVCAAVTGARHLTKWEARELATASNTAPAQQTGDPNW